MAWRPVRCRCHKRVPPSRATPCLTPALIFGQAFRSPAQSDGNDGKPTHYPELLRARHCRLVVFGIETGRWSQETAFFIRLLERASSPWLVAPEPKRLPVRLAKAFALQSPCWHLPRFVLRIKGVFAQDVKEKLVLSPRRKSQPGRRSATNFRGRAPPCAILRNLSFSK